MSEMETEWPGDREGRVLWVRWNGQVIGLWVKWNGQVIREERVGYYV